MAASESVNPVDLLREQLEGASPDLLRAMVKTFAEALMSAEADAICGAEYGQRSDERVNSRNGYRPREWDTRAGTIELAIPKLRSGLLLPGLAADSIAGGPSRPWSRWWPRRYLLGVSTRRVEKLVEQLGVRQLSEVAGLGDGRSTWTRRSRRSATGPWTPAHTRSCGWTR